MLHEGYFSIDELPSQMILIFGNLCERCCKLALKLRREVSEGTDINLLISELIELLLVLALQNREEIHFLLQCFDSGIHLLDSLHVFL